MRKRKVPLVEDDPLVRLALVDADLEPVQAANASEAIAILQARPDIPAVLSDVGMPGPMNGLSLA
jgi:CheY-like chemotaxis protein